MIQQRDQSGNKRNIQAKVISVASGKSTVELLDSSNEFSDNTQMNNYKMVALQPLMATGLFILDNKERRNKHGNKF